MCVCAYIRWVGSHSINGCGGKELKSTAVGQWLPLVELKGDG